MKHGCVNWVGGYGPRFQPPAQCLALGAQHHPGEDVDGGARDDGAEEHAQTHRQDHQAPEASRTWKKAPGAGLTWMVNEEQQMIQPKLSPGKKGSPVLLTPQTGHDHGAAVNLGERQKSKHAHEPLL